MTNLIATSIASAVLMGLTLNVSADAPPRTDEVLSSGWRFIREDVPEAAAVGFDDSPWASVAVPHTWNAEDGQSTRDYYRGPGWYRRHVRIDDAGAGGAGGAAGAGKHYFLRFEAAATIAEVYINGERIGGHRGAFGAFCVDATEALRHGGVGTAGGDNVVAVRVSNEAAPDVAPLSGDFVIFGGLYRPVHLLAMDSLCIDPLDDASPGVYLAQTQVTPERAWVAATVRVRNGSDAAKAASVRCTVIDADGKEVARCDRSAEVAAGAVREVVQSFAVERPHMWAGRSDPYLYRAVVEVVREGAVVDRVEQPLGLRSIRVDPDKGFFLNGKHYDLHGVNRHQDRLGKGWAISDDDHAEDMALILEMGCTGIRLAHYQHAETFYSLCDQAGLVAWAELCLVDKLSPSPAFADNARQQLHELIKQNFNHPSICVWGLSNELSQSAASNEKIGLLQELNALAKSLDPSRPMAAADFGSPTRDFNNVTDVIGFNRYYGWYEGAAADWTKIDSIHEQIPGRCAAITEYGAGAGIHQHEAAPAQPKTSGPWHPEEYQSLLHERAWTVMKSRSWLWGTFVWNMFDFATPIRHEGEEVARNDKGLVTYDRKTRKDAFYFYKANWVAGSVEPVVYIAERRFTPRPLRAAGVVSIKVYSNLESVELTVNGQSMGAKTSADHVFVWADMRLEAGKNTVAAVGRTGDRVVRDEIVWKCER